MRLIDADALKKDAREVTVFCDYGGESTFMAVDVENIDYAPTIDAEPVRHGGTTTCIDTDDIDKFQSRIILTENKKSKFCRVFYEDDMVYGHWTEDGCCSECGEMGLYNGNEEIVRSRYCPHCGGKMDEKEDAYA